MTKIIQRSQEKKTIQLLQDCPSVSVPDGKHHLLKKGSHINIVQDLGISVSINFDGRLYRIANKDVDALGVNKTKFHFTNISPRRVNEAHIWQVLRQCYDPEISINIIDLGLIYALDCSENGEGKNCVNITMTLTSAGCGLGTVLIDEIASQLREIPNVDEVDIKLTFDPPWDISRISEAGRLELGII